MESEKLSTTRKREIALKLRIYVSSFSSQKKACTSLHDVSEATVLCMIGEKEFCWDAISDAMWRNVAKQVGEVANFNSLVETQNFHTLNLYFDLARDEGATFAIIGNAGWGKSYTAKWYSAVNRKNNVYYMECAEYWNKKKFLQYLLLQMGKNGAGMGTAELMESILREMRRQNKPLIIMDEIDKLPDPVLKFFITLYNELNKICGFVWLSTNAIEKRIKMGLDKNTIGYHELYSRVGASFISLNMPSVDEISEICKENGISDKEKVALIVNEVRQIGGDLRRVDRNILKDKIKTMRKKLKAA